MERSEDDDLTSLSWLQDKNLLKGINLRTSVVGMGKQESPTSDYVEDCPSEQSESTCSSINSSSPVPPHHNKNKHPHHIPYDPKVHVTSKPPYSFSCLIFMSIEDSKGKALPVKEIYSWILDHFPYYKNAPTGWKNSVRHNLSLNKCFRKVDKATNLGKGSLWMVDPVYRPNLVQALMKAPYHPYTNLDRPSPPANYKRHPSPVVNEVKEEVFESQDSLSQDEIDDVDAATAMLFLKHGPHARIHLHTPEEFNRRQTSIQSSQNGIKKESLVDGVNLSRTSVDHTYSVESGVKEEAQLSADEAFADGSDSNSSWSACELEERRKTAEGADALLNLAGIRTSPEEGEPPTKRQRALSLRQHRAPVSAASTPLSRHKSKR